MRVNPRDTITLFAVQSIAKGSNNLNSVTLLKKNVKRAQTIFNEYLLDDLTYKTESSIQLPDSYTLFQNYPNPFNPLTKIKFEIPVNLTEFSTNTTLLIYDITGKQLAILVNEKLQPGVYEYSFNGSGLGSGVYFYKLQSGRFVQTRKMILMK